MRDEKFLSFDLSFSLRERVKTRERAISKTRDKISRLIQKNRRRQKFCPKDCFFCSKKNNSFALSIKNSKKQQTNFPTGQQRENNEKIIRRRSPLGRNSTHHFVVLLIYSPRT